MLGFLAAKTANACKVGRRLTLTETIEEARAMPAGYSKTQIRLHWIIFILVLFQFVLHETIALGWEDFLAGGVLERSPLVIQHVAGGLLILFLVIWRLSVRFSRGAPALPKNEPVVLKGLAHLTHWVLYALLILTPLSGAVAFFGGSVGAGAAHEILRGLMMLFVLIHLLGALYQQFVLKTNIMDRMRTPDES